MHLIHFVFLITVAQYVGDTEGCSNSLPNLYSPVGVDVSITFQYNIPVSELADVRVTNEAGAELVTLIYFGGNVAGQAVINPRVDFTGNFNTGNLSFTLNNIQTPDRGLYTLLSNGVTKSCVTLYVTGKPAKPVISPAPVSVNVGNTATCTCTSRSTTVPTGSGLTMFYTWRRNGADLTSGGRYTMSDKTLSVANVVKGDASDTFTCTAREDKGPTSDESALARIDVTYGPDAVILQPTTTDYSYEEGDSINTITCSADCNHPCTIQWSRQPSTSSSSGRVLSLGSADKSDVGTYTCTASRGTSSSRDSPSVTVRVNYGPGVVSLNTSQQQTTQEEGTIFSSVLCSADCNPSCTYQWVGDKLGVIPTTDGVLSLGSLSRTDDDTYRCTASRSGAQPQVSTGFVVTVQYGPGVVSLNTSQLQITQEEGTPFSPVLCSADCNPSCTYQWGGDRRGVIPTTDGVLSIGSLSRTDDDTYRCTASRSGAQPQLSTGLKVTIHYGPGTSIVMTPSATVQTLNEDQGSISNINCSAECNPGCTYSWSGKRTGPVTPVNDVLSLGVANRIKADRYTCTAIQTGYQAMTATISVTIIVRYGPTDIQLNPPTGEVIEIEGSTTQDISCSSDCYPGCVCTWSQFNNNGVFHLGTVYRNVSGNYTCTCINSYTQTGWRLDKRVTVTVQYFPDLHITTNKVVTEHDTNIQLSCTADGVPAQYTFGGWTHFLPDNRTAQHDLSNTAIDGNVVRLTLPTVTYMDTGIYRCMVSNGITDYRTKELTAMAETTLLVNGSPVITQQEENTAGKTSSNATLSAKVFSQSDIVVQWYKEQNGSWSLVSDGRFHSDVTVTVVSPLYYGVPVKQSGFMASLHIEHVQSSDFAEYRLVVRNNIGNTSNTTTFRSNGPPDPPKDFSVITGSETANNVSFKWMSGFHGGAEQQFVIEYSEAGNIWAIGVTVAGGFDENKLFQGTVSGLEPDTTYNFRLHAESNNGNSSVYLKTTTTTTKAVPLVPDQPGNLIGPIAGGLGGAVVISILVIVIVVFVRRYKGKSDTGNDRKALDNSEEDIVINDMYGSHQMHINVQSSASSSGNASQLYAEVVKPKKKPVNEDANLYAMVDKSKKQNPKPKDKATPKKGKGAAPETVYENPETLQGKNAGNADLVYENHKPPARPSRGKNENSLHYADLEFVKNKHGGKKLVIHGLENSTDYAEVVIGKRGTPLPDSDDETPSAKQE